MTQKMAEKDTKEEILKSFRLFDDDEARKILFKNLVCVAHELGESLTEEELQEMINEADRDGDEEVKEKEFLKIMPVSLTQGSTCFYIPITRTTSMCHHIWTFVWVLEI